MVPLKPLMSFLWLLLGRVSIRTKIFGIAVGSVVLLGLAVALQTRFTLQTTLDDQLRQLGLAVARDVSARSADALLTGQLVQMHQILEETIRSYPQVRYVFITDAAGYVVDHTFGPGFPRDLISANKVGPGGQPSIEILSTEEGHILDVAVPILEGHVGTARVGMSYYANRTLLDLATGQILTTTGVAAVLALGVAFLLSLSISRAVGSLLDATEAVKRGELGRTARIWAPDELGRLGQAFNEMSSSLASSRAELLRRNLELEALNAAAAGLADVRDPDEVLAVGLGHVLAAGSFSAGAIQLVEADGQLKFRVWRGLSEAFVDACSAVSLGEGIQGAVALTGEAISLPGITQAHKDIMELEGQDDLKAFAAVPVRGRAGVVGVLSVARKDDRPITTEDLRLLRALGSQIGVSLENARLWEELRQREAMRAQLLARAIAAQEEERKRIARELHDETSQALTSLLIGLDRLATGGDLAVPEEVNHLRNLVSEVLDSLHHLSVELRPSSLDDAGLVPGIARYLKEYERRHGIIADLRVMGLDNVRLLPAVETAIFRIVQEALTNVARHAEASGVSVLLETRKDQLVVVIEDDGVGFEAEQVLRAPLQERLGLAGMAERAALVGGSISIESKPGMGTTVFLSVPLSGNRVEEGWQLA
jgi:signal transduction histidine kinase